VQNIRPIIKRMTMKILFVSHSSILKYHQQKLDILAAVYGHNICLCTPPYWFENGIKFAPYTGGSINYVTGNVYIFKKRMFQIYLNACDIVRKFNPDIVHVEEEPFTMAAWQFIKAAKKFGKKSLFFTWENLSRSYNPMFTYFNNYCIKNSGGIIAGNEEAKNIFKSRGFSGPIEVIPQYGLNMEDFIIRKRKSGPSGFILGYVGRITPEKGIETLIDSLKGLDNVKLMIAGSGNSEYTAKIKERASMTGAKIEFSGFLGRDKIASFLASIDALVLPSLTTPRWKEQFGRVLIEAFASKIAVIGSSSGEIPNVIGGGGLIFKEGSPESLRECIRKISSDSVLYDELAEKGFERVKTNYTNDIIAGKINGLYGKM
jgi:glycosyltransferase involved in cell wall biosynthesis